MTPSRRAAIPYRNTTILLGLAASALFSATIVSTPGARAKTPGKTYCYNRICHRVLTLAETRRAIGKRRSVVASYYSDCKVDRYNPCGLTSSGALFRPGHADNAASPIYPNGTKLLVWNPSNKRAAVVRIDNAGPYWRNRTLDLSRAAAQQLGFRHRGVARLVVQVLQAPTRRQARYRRYRKYAPVRGYLGRFASLSSALNSVNPSAPARAIARIALPVKNTYLAERRIWLARMVETGPLSIGHVRRPNLRLPVRLVRAEFDGWPKFTRPRHRKVAALATPASPTRKAREKLAQRRPPQKKPNRRAASRPAPAPKVTASQPTQQTKPVPSANNTPPANVQTVPPVRPSRPHIVWRQEILGVSRGGA